MPQLKVLKPTDTRWLSHVNTIRSDKRYYITLVVTLEAIHEKSLVTPRLMVQHALLLKELEIVAANYMLSEVLGSIARLCKNLQKRV